MVARLLLAPLLPLMTYVGVNQLVDGGLPDFSAANFLEDARENSMAGRIGDTRLDLRLALDVRGELLLVNQHEHVVRRIRTVAR